MWRKLSLMLAFFSVKLLPKKSRPLAAKNQKGQILIIILPIKTNDVLKKYYLYLPKYMKQHWFDLDLSLSLIHRLPELSSKTISTFAECRPLSKLRGLDTKKIQFMFSQLHINYFGLFPIKNIHCNFEQSNLCFKYVPYLLNNYYWI